MKSYYVVLFAAFLSPAVDCILDWESVDKYMNAFADAESSFQTMEKALVESLTATKNFFADPTTKAALTSFTIGTSVIPVVGQLFSIASSISGLLESETEWKDTFTKVVAEEIKKGHVNNDLENMIDVLHSIKNRFPLLNGTFTGESEITWKTLPEVVGFATDIYSRLEEMIISFAKPDSHYKRYTLMGGPLLVEISLLVLTYEPIASQILKEASRNKLSCKVYDAIVDYLPYLLSDRYKKTNVALLKTLQVRQMQYDPSGYAYTESLMCDDSQIIRCENDNICLRDGLNKRSFSKTDQCEGNYAKHVRELVEKRFPLEQLNEMCGQERGQPTGESMILSHKNVIHL